MPVCFKPRGESANPADARASTKRLIYVGQDTMPIQQSLCYPFFQQADTDPDTVFARLVEIGYPAVEFHFRNEKVDAMVEQARGHGLTVCSICGHRSLTVGMNNPDEHDRIENELRENIDFAAAHDIPGLICFTGNVNDGQSERDAMDATVRGFKRIAPYAEQNNVTLNLELLNSKIDHEGYQCDHTAWGVRVCEQVDSPNMKLLYDIYHMQIMEGDVIRTLGDNIQHIGHIHTAGVPGRYDLDDEQELNYPAICRALASSGYTGYVGHEFSPKGDPLTAAATAFTTCDV